MRKLSVFGVACAWLLLVAGGCGDRGSAVAVQSDDPGTSESQIAADLDSKLDALQGGTAEETAGSGGESALSAAGDTGGTQPIAKGGQAPAGTVSVRLNLPKGGKYQYRTDVTTEQGAQGQSATTKTTIDQLVTVKDQRNDKFVVETKITDVKLDLPAEARQQGLDPSAMIEGMKQSAWEAEFDGLGTPTNMRVTAGNEMARTLAGQGMDLGFMGIIYPRDPVKVGSTWSGSMDLSKMLGPAAGMMKVTKGGKIPVNYTVKEIERSGGKTILVLEIKAKGETEFAMNMPTQDGSTQEQKMTVSMDSTGSARIDASTGLPVSMNGDGRAVINMMGMTINQRTRSNMRLVQ